MMRRMIGVVLLACGLFLAACQQGAEKVERENFVDNAGLQNGRALLIAHMTQKENLSVPPAAAWNADGTYAEDDWQVYRFTSGDWLLTLARQQGEAEPSMYRARVSGPQSFIYTADIFADGRVTPNQ